MNRKEKLEFKKSLKRLWVYFAIILPLFILIIYFLGVLKVPVALTMFVAILVGVILYFLFEWIYVIILKKKQQKEELKPKSKDTFGE